MQPYIGVTGFTRLAQVQAALECVEGNQPRKLMVGVLASHKSRRGWPMKARWRQQTPRVGDIAELFLANPRVVNLIHYSGDGWLESSLLLDMLTLAHHGGPNFHGFQLNVAWPSTNVIGDYRQTMGYDHRIVLQIGARAMEEVEGDTNQLLARLYHYVGLVSDILLDPSGGHGKAFDLNQARGLLRAVVDNYPKLGVGVAGGLGPGAVLHLRPLVLEFPNLSIDAQGKLRDEANDLDFLAVSAYLAQAQQLFA